MISGTSVGYKSLPLITSSFPGSIGTASLSLLLPRRSGFGSSVVSSPGRLLQGVMLCSFLARAVWIFCMLLHAIGAGCCINKHSPSLPHVCLGFFSERERCHSWNISFHLQHSHQSLSSDAEAAHPCCEQLDCTREAKLFYFRKNYKISNGF